MEDLNALADRVHEANKKWWIDIQDGVTPLDRNKGELLMLVVSELSEAMEGARKNLMDDKLPHRLMLEVELADAKIRILDFAAGFGLHLSHKALLARDVKPDNVGEQLLIIVAVIASAYVHFGDDNPRSAESTLSYALALIDVLASQRNLDLDGAFEEKMAYNAVREDHTHEARKLAEGKKW